MARASNGVGHLGGRPSAVESIASLVAVQVVRAPAARRRGEPRGTRQLLSEVLPGLSALLVTFALGRQAERSHPDSTYAGIPTANLRSGPRSATLGADE